MRDEMADVQRRITNRNLIEVQNPQSLTVQNRVRVVEIAMNHDRRELGHVARLVVQDLLREAEARPVAVRQPADDLLTPAIDFGELVLDWLRLQPRQRERVVKGGEPLRA